jgi:hypothetical protein
MDTQDPVPTEAESVAELRAAFTYNPDTGLIRTNARAGVAAGIDPIRRGAAKAGKEYPAVRINGRDIHAARIAFAHVRKEAPAFLPFPKDGNPFNLRWENWEPREGPGRPRGSSDSNSRKALLERIARLEAQLKAAGERETPPDAPAAPESAPEPALLSPPFRLKVSHAEAILRNLAAYLGQLRTACRVDTTQAEAAAAGAADGLKAILNPETQN